MINRFGLKSKLILMAIILAIIIVYQFLLTIIVLSHINAIVLFLQLCFLFYLLYRIIWV